MPCLCFPNFRQKLRSWVPRGWMWKIFPFNSPKRVDIPEVRVDSPSVSIVPLKGGCRPGSSRFGCLPSPASSGGLPASEDGDPRFGTGAQLRGLKVRSAASSSYHADSDISTLDRNSQATPETGGQVSDVSQNFERISRTDSGHESTLREKLCDIRRERPPGSHKYFIPADDLEHLLTADAISIELQAQGLSEDRARSYSEDILKSARKLFAILVYVRQGEKVLEFLEEDIEDSDLPFIRSDMDPKAKDYKLCSSRRPGQPIKCMENWSRHLVEDFGRDQWWMLVPIFEYHEGIEHYDLQDNCVLPWVEDEESGDREIQGGFGSVSKVAIHQAHQRFVGSSNHITLPQFVAIKRLHSTNEEHFRTEVNMLKKLKKRQHAHLVNLLATFRYDGHYYLIFPYAHCNLRQYWQYTTIPDFTPATSLWMLGECRFVASALLMVHESSSTQEFAYSGTGSSSSRASGSRSEDEGIRRYGRHGDIKAENILWFQKEDDSPGHLVVADFGLMAYHTKDTRSNIDARHITGSPTYEGPELALHAKISRAFDLWSLGCLYLEFITWLVCGWQHLQRFPEVREMKGPPAPQFYDDTFFTIVESENRAVVRQTVKDWIADLHEMPRASAFVHDFLKIISDRLLVVIPGKRIRIGQLNEELRSMLQRASTDASYLADPKPYPPRTQTPDPMSLAAFHRNGQIISPSIQQGVPLPKRLSGILDSAAPRTSTPPIRCDMFENVSPTSSPRLS